MEHIFIREIEYTYSTYHKEENVGFITRKEVIDEI